MKKFSLILIVLLSSCSKEEAPKITIQEYSKQVVVMNGVVDKILEEKDAKKMFAMADAIESSRAVECKPVVDECNKYYHLINKVVSYTKDGQISDDKRMELFKLRNEFQEEIQIGEEKIRQLWGGRAKD